MINRYNVYLRIIFNGSVFVFRNVSGLFIVFVFINQVNKTRVFMTVRVHFCVVFLSTFDVFSLFEDGKTGPLQ